MTTSKRRVPTWLLPIVAFVAVLGIGLGVTYLLTDGGDRTTSGTTPTPATKASKKADPLPAHKTVDAFDRLMLPLFTEWEPMAGAGNPDEAMVYVDAAACDQSTTCPSLVINNLEAEYFEKDRNGDKPLKGTLTECEVADADVSPTETFAIDGERALYYELICGPQTNHIWVVPSKSVELAAYGGDTELDIEAVERMVKAIIWK